MTAAILIFITAVAALLHPVFAQDSTSGATTRKQIYQQRIDTRIQKIDTRVASREAYLKAKLDSFKDKRKAEIANRVNTNLNKINQNQTDQMKKHLALMTALLDKLEARINSGTPDIKDVSAAKTAISAARAIIATTSAAVLTQSQKDYAITISTESKVRVDTKTMRDQLYKDIMALRKSMIDTKQSVSNAVRVAKSGTMKEGTASGKQ